MFKNIYSFFDKLEDRIRAWFSRRPILYAFFGGIGIVLFWRGVWHSADTLMDYLFPTMPTAGSMDVAGGWPWWDGPASMLLGGLLLLSMGVFVSEFIGNEIIISGLRREKKLVDQTEDEVQQEAADIKAVKKEITVIENKVDRIRKSKPSKPVTKRSVK